MIGQGDYISLSYFLSLWYNTNVKILSLLSGKFRYIFLCSDSGDWGHPSASIVYRFPRNLWERDTVLAGSVFTLFLGIQFSCCLFHYSGAWGSIPQQAMRGVVTGFRGNELPCLLGKLSFLRNDVISVSFIPMIIYFPGIDFSAIRLYNNW